MSIGALNWAAQTPLTGSVRWTLMALANYADDVDGYCFPGQKTLAAWAGISERTIREQLATLEADGWIERAHRMRDGWRTSDEYVVMFDRFTPAPKERRTLRRDSPVGAADSVRSTGESRRTEPSVEPSGIHQTDSAPDLGFEVEIPAKITKPRGVVRPDVERLSLLLVEQLSELKLTAAVDANTRRAVARLLDRPDTDAAELEHVIRWSFSEESWWRGKLTTVSRWAAKYPDLRARMLTSGPSAPPERPAAPDRPWHLDAYFSGSQGDLLRRDLFISRSADPRSWHDTADQLGLLQRLLAAPVVYAPGSDEHERLIRAWDNRWDVADLREVVPAWATVRV